MARKKITRFRQFSSRETSPSTIGPGLFALGGSLGMGLNTRDHAGIDIGYGLVIGDYPGYTNDPPAAYWEAGRVRANRIFPRTDTGAVNWRTGVIGIADFSGSVGHLIWGAAQSLDGLGRYIRYARTSRPGYPLRAMVDTSLPDYATYWNDWVPARLAANSLTSAQIGIATLSNGLAFGPSGAVAESQQYADVMEYISDSADMQMQLVSEIMTRFPNVRLILAENMVPMHFSERLSVYEPYIFLRYFSLQRIIHDFINNFNYTGSAYWLGWGADYYVFPGMARAFDGLGYVRADFNDNITGPNGSDGVHPNTNKTPDLVNRVLNPRLRLSGSPMEIVCGDMIEYPGTLLSSLNSTTAASSYTVGPFDIPAGQLVLVAVQSAVSTGSPNIPTLSGGITWAQVATRSQGLRRVTVFRGASATGVTGVTLTVDFAAQNQTACRVQVNNIPNAAWGSANQGVVQAVTGSSASATSLTLTLAAAESIRNGVVAFWHSTVGATADSESSLGPNAGLLYSSWRGHPPENNQITLNLNSSDVVIGIALEIRRA